MSSESPQPEARFSKHGTAFFSSIFAIVCAGCASPGPPRPPSLNLPALVTDLNAERVGDRVLLHWTTPSRTTDDLPIKGDMAAQVCRETGARPATPAERLTACTPVLRLAVAPGISEVADTLPRALSADPAGLITYRIRVFNAAGRSAGDSSVTAFAAAGSAPPPLEAFSASASEDGAILEWRRPQLDGRTYVVDIKMRNLSAKRSQTGKSPGAHLLTDKGRHPQAVTPSKPPREEVHLRSAETQKPSDSAPESELTGAVDPTAKMGETYTYVAERVRSVEVGGHLLEIHSEPTSVVTLAMRDTFPPRSPSALAAIPSVAREQGPETQASRDGGIGKPYIDLSWEPNTEPDLAGYIVYRQLARPNGDPQGPLARLTPLPIPAPAYRDMAVALGQRYIYSVTAVDASGNESAPSAQAQEVIPSPI